MENVLEINSLNKTYGGKFKAIDDLSLNVNSDNKSAPTIKVNISKKEKNTI